MWVNNLRYGNAGKCVPGVLAPFHWTMSSPVPGFDSRLRSVGGDRAEEENEHGHLEGQEIIKTDT